NCERAEFHLAIDYSVLRTITSWRFPMSYIRENWFVGIKNRLLQEIARKVPGALTLRPLLHRWRGVEMEKNVWIGYDAVIETAHPKLVRIQEGAIISIQVLILAHFGGWKRSVVIERN